MARDLEACADMIERSDEIKREVVEKDPTEQGDRALLNFGHTLGHAIEKLKNFQMLHGHCVGVGCIAAAAISQKTRLSDGGTGTGYPGNHESISGGEKRSQVLIRHK